VKRIHVVLFVMLALAGHALFPSPAGANTIQVGPGKQYAAPCAAIAAAAAGDTIQIDTSGSYSGDVCQWNTNNLTLTTAGPGRAVLNAAGKSSQGKAIWVISGNNTVVENIEFTGAAVADLNGAGIRAEGQNLTIRNCYFHDNQEGLLTDPGQNSTILIEFSEFARNGAGDGFSHNLYIGNIGKFIFRYNYSHSSFVGHLLKSRAAENDIYYNRFSDESDGTGSYEIDIPNGGLSFIIGNLIEQGPLTQNSTIIAYQEEGANAGNPDHELFVVNNTLVNDYTKGTFVLVDNSVSVPAIIKNNIFQGPGSITSQSRALQANNFSGNAQLVSPSTYDYHLTLGSPAIDKGANPGTGAGVSLTPIFQYVHPACAEGRSTTGSAIDIGAYEFNGGNATPPANAPSRCGASTPPPPAPVASLSPSSLVFPGQTLGTTSAAKPITLSNTGNAALAISGISFTGTNSGDFSQTNNCGGTLAPGANCSINVTFTPSAAGNRAASISIGDNAFGSPQSANVSGAGVATAPSASLSPTSLTFSGLPPGATSAAQQVTLTNSGNASLNISGISVSGDFAQTNVCGSNLAAGANCAISVTFTPTAGGTRTGTLSVTDDASGSPHKVSLSGTGQAPAANASVSPSLLTFSSSVVGSSPSAQQVKLSNSGNAPLSISGITSSGDFSQTNNCGSSLAAASSCTVTVTFKPTGGGARTGSLSITDNVSGSPQTVSLAGTGMDFVLSSSPNSATVNPGQTANLMLAVSPDGGFAQSVSLICSGAPAKSVCTVTPSSVTPSGSSASSVAVAVSTTASSLMIPQVPSIPPTAILRVILTFIALLLFFFLAAANDRRRVLAFSSLALLAVFAGGCVGLASKTGPPSLNSGTPAGTYPLTITATSAALSHSATLTLRVN
jgi:hypothetical protein